MEIQTSPQTIPPEEATAIKEFSKKREFPSLLMRIVNGTPPIREAALKAINDLTEDKAEPSIPERLHTWLARCSGKDQQ